MSHNAYTLLPLGEWPLNQTVEPEHLTDFEKKLFKAVNGDDGGLWAPTNPIEFAGEGVRLVGDAPLTITNGSQLVLNEGAILDLQGESRVNVATLFKVSVAANAVVVFDPPIPKVITQRITSPPDGYPPFEVSTPPWSLEEGGLYRRGNSKGQRLLFQVENPLVGAHVTHVAVRFAQWYFLAGDVPGRMDPDRGDRAPRIELLRQNIATGADRDAPLEVLGISSGELAYLATQPMGPEIVEISCTTFHTIDKDSIYWVALTDATIPTGTEYGYEDYLGFQFRYAIEQQTFVP